MTDQTLTAGDRENLDAFLGYVLDEYAKGVVGRQTAINVLSRPVVAAFEGKHDKARAWFQQGRKFVGLLQADQASAIALNPSVLD